MNASTKSNTMSMPKIILFDIDGTLLLSGQAGQTAMESTLKELFEVEGPVHDIPVAGRTDFAICSDLFCFYGIEPTVTNWEKYRAGYFARLPSHLESGKGSCLPGVVKLLEVLQGMENVDLGLLTGNFEQGAWLKLNHFKIGHYFDFGGFGDQHLSRNDVARMAQAEIVNRHQGYSPEHTWVIGDTPADVECARAIGAKVMATATGMYDRASLAAHSPDILVDDLTQVDAWMSLLD